MLFRSDRNPGAPWWQIAFWDFLGKPACWLVSTLLYHARWWGVQHVPRRGGVLLICNHQSYLDLPLIGIGLEHRHFHSMAASWLFQHPIFRRLIATLNAFPVEQGKGDVRAVRRAIELLKREQLVLIFPEGSRSRDGSVLEFETGLMLLIRRARPTVVCAGLDGPFEVWPRDRKRPRLTGRMGIAFDQPIEAETLLAMSPEDASRMLHDRVVAMREDVRRRHARAAGMSLDAAPFAQP